MGSDSGIPRKLRFILFFCRTTHSNNIVSCQNLRGISSSLDCGTVSSFSLQIERGRRRPSASRSRSRQTPRSVFGLARFGEKRRRRFHTVYFQPCVVSRWPTETFHGNINCVVCHRSLLYYEPRRGAEEQPKYRLISLTPVARRIFFRNHHSFATFVLPPCRWSHSHAHINPRDGKSTWASHDIGAEVLRSLP